MRVCKYKCAETARERSARVRDADGAGSAASHSLLIPAPFAEYRSRGDSFREWEAYRSGKRVRSRE
jgi:hypothetical protein